METFEFWDDILSGAYKDLTSVVDRPARIAGSSLTFTLKTITKYLDCSPQFMELVNSLAHRI